MDKLSTSPIPVQWTEEMVTRFWDAVAKSPLDDLSYSKHLGKELVQFIQAHVPPPAKLLDFGAGGGHLAGLLIEAGYSVGVYELSPDRLDSFSDAPFTKSERFLGVFTPQTQACFDAVLAFEVFEHIMDDSIASAMVTLRNFSGPQLRVIGSVPWQETLAYSLCICPVCTSLFHRWQHLRSFTQQTLEEFLKEHGFPFIQHDVDRKLQRIFFVTGIEPVELRIQMFSK